MLFLLASQALASAPVPRGYEDISGDRAILSLFTVDDYPAEAIKNGWRGEVQTELKVNKLGRVDECRVIKSSGYSILDVSTCRLLQHRARFEPAKDPNGQPVESLYVAPPIRWRLTR